ncbi:MAG TPA: ABC transporter substrate-binding protein [Candidatus Binatia bacterium]|jgi:NitT/TauT family transport system substrate-binding protein
MSRSNIFGFRAYIIVLAILFVVTAGAAERASAQPLKSVTIVYAGLSGNQAPGWVAQEAGFFRKNGLEVQLVHVVGGPRAVQVLTSGSAVVAQVSGLPTVQSALQGTDIVFIAGILNTLNYQFIVDKTIQKPDDLKGKSVAVSRAGSSSDFATRFALDRYGLVPGKDVTLVEIGSQPDRFAALESGRIQGVMVEVPLTLKAKKMGFKVLADLQMLGLEYQATGLATTQAMIKSRPEIIRSIMKAYVEAIHYYKTHPKESIAILQKYLKTDDMEALKETYEAIGLTLIPEKPYPSLRGIQMMLSELSAREPKAQTAKPEQFVDLTFIKELDSSGYIDKLYKTKATAAAPEAPKPAPPAAPAKEAKEKVATAKPAPAASEKAKPEKAPPAPAAAKSAPPPPEKSASQEYAIALGDTLSRLAQKNYGDATKWPKIYEANKQTIKNPNYIYVGQKIVIPAEGA